MKEACRLAFHLLQDKGWVLEAWRQNKQTLNVGERGQSTRNSSSYRKCFSSRVSKHGWMASLRGHVEWETAEGRWVGESDAGNTLIFLTVIRFQNHELTLLFSYIYLFVKRAVWLLCVSGIELVIIFGFHVESFLLIRLSQLSSSSQHYR